MSGAMLNDVVYDAYLANDRTLDDPETVQVEKGGWIKLRIINGASASNMWVDLGALTGSLVAVDGHAIHPIPVRASPWRSPSAPTSGCRYPGKAVRSPSCSAPRESAPVAGSC